MRIAISTRRVIDPKYGEVRDALSEDWQRYLYTNWPNMVIIPLINYPENVKRWASELAIDAAILSNGNDWRESKLRDRTESILVDWCRDQKKPILGICRGFQALNVIFGGQLNINISKFSGYNHSGTRHKVKLTEPTFSLFSTDDVIEVNSFHDQGITRSSLAPAFIPFALSEGDIVEGFYHRDEAILGIQWHPERPGAPNTFDRNLINKFLMQGAFWTNKKSEM